MLALSFQERTMYPTLHGQLGERGPDLTSCPLLLSPNLFPVRSQQFILKFVFVKWLLTAIKTLSTLKIGLLFFAQAHPLWCFVTEACNVCMTMSEGKKRTGKSRGREDPLCSPHITSRTPLNPQIVMNVSFTEIFLQVILKSISNTYFTLKGEI